MENKQATRIALYGLFGWGSLGDAATQHSVIDYLKKQLPDVDLCCICPNPDDAAWRFGLPAYPIGRDVGKAWAGDKNRILRALRRIFVRIPQEVDVWLRPQRFLQDVQLLVVSGGGILGDYGVGPWRWPYELFRWSIGARISGTKLIFMSVGAGPLDHPLSRWFVRHALGASVYRSYRDVHSKDYIRSIGFPNDDDHVFPDQVFGLETPMPVSDTAATGTRPPVIGINPIPYCEPKMWTIRDASRYRTYLDKMGTMVAALLDKGCHVHFLVGDTWADQLAVDDIVAWLGEQQIAFAPESVLATQIPTVAELQRRLADVDFVVGSRFHVLLMGLMQGKLGVSIAYNAKSDSLLQSVGLGAYCYHVDTFVPETVLQSLEQLRTEAAGLAPYAASQVEKFRHEVIQQWDDVFLTNAFHWR